MRNDTILGIHHVTAIASDPQANVDFYAGLLGLRLVKRTVNYDDPQTYHLYYGDGVGSPGTILTFFPWPGARRGRIGSGQATATAFSVPVGSLDFWTERLSSAGVEVGQPVDRVGDERVLRFSDHDGLRLELIASATTEDLVGVEPWTGSGVSLQHAIRGFHSVTLSPRSATATSALLSELFALQSTEVADGERVRYSAPGAKAPGTHVDVVVSPSLEPGRIAAGSVHHVAWRLADDDAQEAWRQRLVEAGLHVSPILDRHYFHSIYFREPGGVLFELATDPPGFGIDETVEELGSDLRVPPWLEPNRDAIAANLLPLSLPAAADSESGS